MALQTTATKTTKPAAVTKQVDKVIVDDATNKVAKSPTLKEQLELQKKLRENMPDGERGRMERMQHRRKVTPRYQPQG